MHAIKTADVQALNLKEIQQNKEFIGFTIK